MVLLVAAVAIWVEAQPDLIDMPWLGAKIVGLLVYIAGGMIAVRRGRMQRAQLGAFIAAPAAFGYVVSVATGKGAAGPFAPLL